MELTVCVIFGGKSSEHEVSRISAYNILNQLNKEKYNVLTVGIKKNGESHLYTGDFIHIKDGSWEENPGKVCVISPNPNHGGILVINKNGDTFMEKVDIYFPVLHGKNGEDGTMQGVFELANIPYVGNGVLASSLCMDKILTKTVLEKAGIPVTEGFSVPAWETLDAVDEKIKASFGYPVVVKPSNAGSSVGITAAENKEELKDALKIAANEDRRILIEKMLDVREVECAVLGSHRKAEASCLGEIVKTTAMYDYETKYVDDTSELVIPSVLEKETEEKIKDWAVKAFSALDCTGLARVDFFIDKTTGDILLNEINTLPGFTDISMYPKLWEASGLSCGALLDRLIEIAKEEFGGR